MIIHEPEITSSEGRVRLGARVESTRRSDYSLLGDLWIEVEDRWGEYLSERSDPFLLIMISMAMFLREDIEVRGPISPRLLFGIRELQHIYKTWWPETLDEVKSHISVVAPPSLRIVSHPFLFDIRDELHYGYLLNFNSVFVSMLITYLLSTKKGSFFVRQ